ncbi:hypothetical protein GUJ93_ZPchr0009g1067 [Zizania palustris]|uniref:SKP1 component POZ domain-containing protein n=1 Tax=Zizania palustris TaxID=103762 RepID=A0A8J5RHQ9_ZIZPA|nr:hypothetical protein GUJ93_ZPchr0009g1067 [Zizania palustris]
MAEAAAALPAAAAEPEAKKILLVSSDNQEFELSEVEAWQSPIVGWKIWFFHIGDDARIRRIRIQLMQVNGETLAKVVEFCKVHSPRDAFAFNSADGRFVRGLDKAVLYDLLVAADHLRMPALIELLHWRIGELTKGREPTERAEDWKRKFGGASICHLV